MLLFCRGRQRNERRFMTHVHSYCSACQAFCLVAFSLPTWFTYGSELTYLISSCQSNVHQTVEVRQVLLCEWQVLPANCHSTHQFVGKKTTTFKFIINGKRSSLNKRNKDPFIMKSYIRIKFKKHLKAHVQFITASFVNTVLNFNYIFRQFWGFKVEKESSECDPFLYEC